LLLADEAPDIANSQVRKEAVVAKILAARRDHPRLVHVIRQ
jgi:hypothetical protein